MEIAKLECRPGRERTEMVRFNLHVQEIRHKHAALKEIVVPLSAKMHRHTNEVVCFVRAYL